MTFQRRRRLYLLLLPLLIFFDLYGVLALMRQPNALRDALVLTVPLLTILFATFYINVAVHEMGHWLAGKLVGFKTLALQVGPLLWTKGEGGQRFQVAPWAGRIGGFAGMWPPDSQNLRQRFAVFVAGGPLASLLFAAATFLWLQTLPGSLRLGPAMLLYQGFVLLLFIYAAFTAVLNLLPFQTHGLRTDGGRLLMIAMGGLKYKRMMAITNMGMLARSGVRMREYPPALFDAITAAPDKSPEHAQGLLLRAFYSFETAHDQEAVQYAIEATETISPKATIMHAVVFNEAAALLAWLGMDAARARRLFDEADGKTLFYRHNRPRAEACVLLAEGRPQEALAKALEAEQELEREMQMHPNLFAFDQDFIRAIKARCEAALGSQVASPV
ncbi:MAG: hypothetical protein QOJ65_430 [Fimbriimonadaceae bacterium]|jgi:hypothetical protein|nr:hypothetical protein [Fimbriimonadaceae bacterium]